MLLLLAESVVNGHPGGVLVGAVGSVNVGVDRLLLLTEQHLRLPQRLEFKLLLLLLHLFFHFIQLLFLLLGIEVSLGFEELAKSASLFLLPALPP